RDRQGPGNPHAFPAERHSLARSGDLPPSRFVMFSSLMILERVQGIHTWKKGRFPRHDRGSDRRTSRRDSRVGRMGREKGSVGEEEVGPRGRDDPPEKRRTAGPKKTTELFLARPG